MIASKLRSRLVTPVHHVKAKAKITYELITRRWRSFMRQFSIKDRDTTIYKMFEAEGHFENVLFLKPGQVQFSDVDLSRVHFRGTNLRGVRFLGVGWWQPALKRNGLYDESFIRLSKDGPFRYLALPVLEETCRNARVALEENRSFNAASDFYVGEMEAARARLPLLRRHMFSVLALYRFVSNYGTSVATAARGLLYLLLLHLFLSVLIYPGTNAFDRFAQMPELMLRTMQILVFQSGSLGESMPSFLQDWMDIVFRTLAPIQMAMLALAFRSRIKRH